MSVEFRFLADEIYSIEQVESICLSLPDVTAEEIVTTISDSLQIIDHKYKQLPVDFLGLSEIRLQGITITGSSSADLDMVPAFSDVVNSVSLMPWNSFTE